MLKKYFNLLILSIVFLIIQSCSFFNSDIIEEVEINSLSFGKSTLKVEVGEMLYLPIKVSPDDEQEKIVFAYSYDSEIINVDTNSSFGVVVKGVKQGQTALKCSYNGYDATCIVTVEGFAPDYQIEPYIYSNSNILQLKPGATEKVFVSLYNGSVNDINDFEWIKDNDSINIEPAGQYCIIKGVKEGYSRIKISHPKSEYPYYIGVYIFTDKTNKPFITTDTNILTLRENDSSRQFSVNVVNMDDVNINSFQYQLIKDDSSTELPVTMETIGNQVIITPKVNCGGTCTLRVTYPGVEYPLDCLIRIIRIVENVYIEPLSTVYTIYGNNPVTVTSTLKNIELSAYSIDNYSYEIDNTDVAEISSYVGNQVIINGKRNGSCKIIISHPNAMYSREVLLIVTGQLTDAIDASCYITTDNNYVRTKVGASPTSIKIALKGGKESDENDFIWNVKSTPVSGNTLEDVISLETPTGTAVYSRMAAETYSWGNAVITPLHEGTAVIEISHPKILYTTEILVKVLSADASLEEPLYFAGSGLVKVLNGSTYNYSVELKGKNKTAADDNNISYSIDNPLITLNSAANNCNIVAPPLNSGCTTSNLSISNPKVEAPKKVIVMTADDQETLDNMKCLYSDKLYYNIEVDDEEICCVNMAGFPDNYNISTIKWTTDNPSVVSISKSSLSDLICNFTGLKSGKATITATLDGYSCTFDIIVYPKGSNMYDPEVYLSTFKNVVCVMPDTTTELNVLPRNISESRYNYTNWEIEDNSVATVIGNGMKATLTALKEGETVINVNHPDSENNLKIYVRVGSEYVQTPESPVVYISAQDVITMVKGEPVSKLQASLCNYSGSSNEFTFTSSDSSIASIASQNNTGVALISPLKAGQCEITIKNPKALYDKKVLCVVGNTAEELENFKYLTTSNNVIAIGEGSSKTVSVSVKNTNDIIIDGYTWTSSNPYVVDVSASGTSAILRGNSTGTCIIKVTNTQCEYPLEIIAQCVDTKLAQDNPYIQLNASVLTLQVGDDYTNVTADLIGGKESDYKDFVWTTNNNSICTVYGQNEVGKLKAIKQGQTYITVNHPKADFPAQLLVVCDDAAKKDCYISVPSSVINLKPTDGTKTITATLVGGENNDKYNFSWSLDVYDIIDFEYSANVCTITPLQCGTCTLTITHPKAAYAQQVIIKVQEYTSFGFPSDSLTMTQGDVSFLNMQIPTTNVKTKVVYKVNNTNVKVTGTNNVAQLEAIQNGSATITAELIATNSGVVQATDELLVYVKEKPLNATYISSASTIYTVEKGKSQTITASLIGSTVTNQDQYSMKWSCNDTDIITVNGLNSSGVVTGNQIYITANKSGSAVIKIEHEKANTPMEILIIVPGTNDKIITLNKTYLVLQKGGTTNGADLTAKIDNAESSLDYNKLDWSIAPVNGQEIARILGNGKTVRILPINGGETTLTCSLGDTPGAVAKCTIKVEYDKSLFFEYEAISISPGGTKSLGFTVSPPDAKFLKLYLMQENKYFDTPAEKERDEYGHGYLSITGIKEGEATLYAITEDNVTATCKLRCNWDYDFVTTGSTTMTIKPDGKDSKSVEFTLNPPTAAVKASVLNGFDSFVNVNIIKDETTGVCKCTVTGNKEAQTPINIELKAINPQDADNCFGSVMLTVNLKYPSITPKLSVIRAGNKSGLKNVYDSAGNKTDTAIVIQDGDNIAIKLDVNESGANVSNWRVTSGDINADENGIQANVTATISGTTLNLKANDYIKSGKIIKSLTRPGLLTKDCSNNSVTGTRWLTDNEIKNITVYQDYYSSYDYIGWGLNGVSEGYIKTYFMSEIVQPEIVGSTAYRSITYDSMYPIKKYNNQNYVAVSGVDYYGYTTYKDYKWIEWYCDGCTYRGDSDCANNSNNHHHYGGFWTVRTEYPNKFITNEEYEELKNIPWYYSKMDRVQCESGEPATLPEGWHHIDIDLNGVSSDTSIIKEYAKTITLVVDHNGVEQTVNIPLNIQVRACNASLSSSY